MSNDIFSNKTLFSFEVFPPKKTSPIDSIYSTLESLKDLSPDFISVTYGAGGSENNSNTIEIAKRIKDVCGVESVAHLPSLYLSKDEVKNVLFDFKKAGIQNILALRGDVIPDKNPRGDFNHADELVSFIKANGDFNVFAGCYPEGHPESKSIDDDIINLKRKVDAGADHLISQLFFDNTTFYSFVSKARRAGINIPIEAGIMPVINKRQIERMVYRCGVVLPSKYVTMMKKYGDSPLAMRDAGIAYAINQIVDLISNGVDGIHLYTMNNAYVAQKISQAVSSLFAFEAA